MKKYAVFIFFLITATFTGCKKDQDYVIYHRFDNQVWKRFNILQFEIPVGNKQSTYDVYFFTHITRQYEFDYLDFNMIMTTPSGEERIKEYRINIKRKEGTFIGRFTNDSSEYSIALKKGITLTKGNLILQIENLVPRLETKAILGVGIRLHPVR